MALPLFFNVHLWGGGKEKKLENHCITPVSFSGTARYQKTLCDTGYLVSEGGFFFCVCESYVG